MSTPSSPKSPDAAATTANATAEPPASTEATAPVVAGPSWEQLKEEGNTFFKANQFARAIPCFTAAIANANPPVAALFSNRCACYLKQKQFAEAFDDAWKCVEIDPQFLKGYGRLAHAAGALGRFDVQVADKLAQGVRNSKAAGNAALAKELEDEVTKFTQARRTLEHITERMARKEYESAIPYANALCRTYPECLRAALLRAECRAVKQPEDALRDLEMFQGDPRTHTSDYIFVRGLATYYNGANGPKAAQALLKHVIECDPDHARAKNLFKLARQLEQHRSAGNTAFQEKRWRDAIQAYTDALAVDPDYAKMKGLLLGNRSAALLEVGDHRQALQDIEGAINNGNATAKIYARRSKLNEKMENWEDALSDLAKAAEMDAEYRDPVRQLKERVRLAKRKDWYKILGVERDAQENDLKRAYKLQAVKWHPDKFSSATEDEKKTAETKFKEVGEAYAILSDPSKRRMYDSGQIDNEAESASGGRPGSAGMGGGGMPPGMDMMDLFSMMMGGGGGGGGMHFGGMGGGMPGGMGGMPGGMGGRGGGARGRRGGGGASFSFPM